jgi:hypothetical protein
VHFKGLAFVFEESKIPMQCNLWSNVYELAEVTMKKAGENMKNPGH